MLDPAEPVQRALPVAPRERLLPLIEGLGHAGIPHRIGTRREVGRLELAQVVGVHEGHEAVEVLVDRASGQVVAPALELLGPSEPLVEAVLGGA